MYFTDKDEVYVPRLANLNNVEFLREGKYIPVLITPAMENEHITKFQFLQKESGRIF